VCVCVRARASASACASSLGHNHHAHNKGVRISPAGRPRTAARHAGAARSSGAATKASAVAMLSTNTTTRRIAHPVDCRGLLVRGRKTNFYFSEKNEC